MRYLIVVASLTLLIACDASPSSPTSETKYWRCMNEFSRMYSQNRPSGEKAHAMCSEKHITPLRLLQGDD